MNATKLNQLLPSKTRDLIKLLESMGYTKAHQSGSHITYKKANCPSLPPLVDCKHQAVGTLRNIAKALYGEDYYNN